MNPGHLRRLMHARYVRAAVAGAAVSATLCSAGIAALEIRHGVSFQAVARFFTRNHLRQADLSNLVYEPDTARRLRLLRLPDLGVNPGGLVYAGEAGLTFHPHLTEQARATRQQHLDNARIYPRLVRHYFASDLDGLLEALNAPQAVARLQGERIERADLSSRDGAALGDSERTRLLRRAARYIHRFAPFGKEPYGLSLADKLRFYEVQNPRGRFVGAFEIQGYLSSSGGDVSHAHAASEHNHYLVIQPIGPGRFKLRDFFKGQVHHYLIGYQPDPTSA